MSDTGPPPPALAPTRPGQLEEGSNLDGLYVTVGPVLAATWSQEDWTTAAGAEISVVRVREREIPAALGGSVGGVAYTSRDGGRFWVEGEVAFRRPLPIDVGLSAGVTVEADRQHGARVGGQGTLWIFAGIVPYVRAGRLEGDGDFVEAGVMVKLPVARFW